MSNVIPQDFYLDRDVVDIAMDLLGCEIYTRIDGHISSGIIVETEAYRGIDDKGCHAFRHGCTPRTASMFENGGIAYVYTCYGVHPMLNIVTGPISHGDAVLIRAIEPNKNVELMKERRGVQGKELCNGPGKAAVALGIKSDFDGVSLLDSQGSIWIEKRKYKLDQNQIYKGSRVGMSKYVAECSHWPWRFYIKGNQYVSRPQEVDYIGMW